MSIEMGGHTCPKDYFSDISITGQFLFDLLKQVYTMTLSELPQLEKLNYLFTYIK